jgi:microcompartment protein CcmL/EutN
MMKKHPALAIIEFCEIPAGLFATDAMLKKAPIAFIKCGTISGGRYLTLIGGSTASVDESLTEGLLHGGDDVLDSILLADVHPRVYDAIAGTRRAAGHGALAIIETDTVASNVRAAETALKATLVELIEIRLADCGLSGKGISVYQGDLHNIEAAVNAAMRFLEHAGVQARHRIIAAPHQSLVAQITSSTLFASQSVLELEGEKVG